MDRGAENGGGLHTVDAFLESFVEFEVIGGY